MASSVLSLSMIYHKNWFIFMLQKSNIKMGKTIEIICVSISYSTPKHKGAWFAMLKQL